MYKFMLTQPDSGYEVYVNLISSSAGRYLGRRPYVINLIREQLATVKLNGERLVIERDLGRQIGTTDIVLTSEKDSIYYAQPVKSQVFSRFAKNRYPEASHVLTMVVARDTKGDYELLDTWIGMASPPFPGDEYETEASKIYWQNHALVHEAQVVKSKTITVECPY